jgi:anaerobic C4-dicarboxylate transporter
MASICAPAATSAALAGPSDAASFFSSALVFFRLRFILLYDSTTSSSWSDALSIFLVSSLVDGSACAAVAMLPVIAIARAATTSARSLVRACGNGTWPFFRLATYRAS